MSANVMGNHMTIDQLTRGVQLACDDLQTALRNNDDVMVEIALRMFCVWSTYLENYARDALHRSTLATGNG